MIWNRLSNKNIRKVESKISDRYFMKFIEKVGELSEWIRKDKRMVNNNIKETIEEELNSKKYNRKKYIWWFWINWDWRRGYYGKSKNW